MSLVSEVGPVGLVLCCGLWTTQFGRNCARVPTLVEDLWDGIVEGSVPCHCKKVTAMYHLLHDAVPKGLQQGLVHNLNLK